MPEQNAQGQSFWRITISIGMADRATLPTRWRHPIAPSTPGPSDKRPLDGCKQAPRYDSQYSAHNQGPDPPGDANLAGNNRRHRSMKKIYRISSDPDYAQRQITRRLPAAHNHDE